MGLFLSMWLLFGLWGLAQNNVEEWTSKLSTPIQAETQTGSAAQLSLISPNEKAGYVDATDPIVDRSRLEKPTLVSQSVSSGATAKSYVDFPKADIWLGYGFNSGNVAGHGAGFGGAYNLTEWLGAEALFNYYRLGSGLRSLPGFIPGVIVRFPPLPPFDPILPFVIRSEQNMFSYAAGPRVSYRTKPVTFYGHLLLGATTIDTFRKQTRFAMRWGGGADFMLTNRLSWRIDATDIVTFFPGYTDFRLGANSGADHRFALNTGLVIKLGGER